MTQFGVVILATVVKATDRHFCTDFIIVIMDYSFFIWLKCMTRHTKTELSIKM